MKYFISKLLISLLFILVFIKVNQCFLNNFKQKFKFFTQRVTVEPPPAGFNQPSNNEFDVQNFLYQKGYSQDKPDFKSKLKSKFNRIKDLFRDSAFKQMIKLYQRFNNLKVTGDLDDETLRTMKAPRCGLPDVRSSGTFQSYKIGAKWNKTNLTWKLLNYTNDLGEKRTRDLTQKAFKVWSDVSSLKFTEVCKSCKADIMIDFGKHVHSSELDDEPFDGAGGTLGHAAFPPDGRIHFDDDEFFTDNKESINYFIVAAHEIGHALGLGHSSAVNALMHPQYKYVEPSNFTLPLDDKLGIQSLYGKPIIEPTKQTSTTKTTKTTPKTSPRQFITIKPLKTITTTTTTKTTTTTQGFSSNYIPPCMHEYDALIVDSNLNINVIVDGDDLWNFDMKKSTWQRKDMFKLYPGLQENVRGGVTCNNTTWFFKGYHLWAYQGQRLLSGFPKEIFHPLYPRHPYTGVCNNNVLYLVKSHLAYELNTKTFEVDEVLYLENLFPNVPSSIETTVKIGEQLYMFKGNCVYKFDDRKNQVLQAKSKYDSWFPCYNYKNSYATCKND